MSYKEIGSKFGMKESAVNMLVRRFRDEISKDSSLEYRLELIRKKFDSENENVQCAEPTP